jgi:hypothetical protein
MGCSIAQSRASAQAQAIDNRQERRPRSVGMETSLPAPHLLVIWHSRTGASEALARAAAEAAAGSRLLRAEAVTAADLLAAGGYLFVAPENLGSLSGLMKEMFDRTYYDVLGQIEGRPYATIIAAGSDGAGAGRQLDRIVTGWRLRRVMDGVIVNFSAQTPEAIAAPKQVPDKALKKCREIGAALAEGLQLGIF